MLFPKFGELYISLTQECVGEGKMETGNQHKKIFLWVLILLSTLSGIVTILLSLSLQKKEDLRTLTEHSNYLKKVGHHLTLIPGQKLFSVNMDRDRRIWFVTRPIREGEKAEVYTVFLSSPYDGEGGTFEQFTFHEILPTNSSLSPPPTPPLVPSIPTP
jgi:hypothetical protein